MEGYRLPAERPGGTASANLKERRKAISSAVAGLWWTDPPPRDLSFGNVRALGFGSPGLWKATIVHFHGGGFRQGCPEMTSRFSATLAERCGVEVICPAYRLAPEHPFPAALNDGMRVLRDLCGAGRSDIWLSGDSAGGGLAASLTALCIAEQIPLAGLLLFSSWLDLTVTSDCYATNAASDPIFSCSAALEAAEQYLQGTAADDPLASPLFGEIAGYPPTLVSVGAGEVLAGDALRFCTALRTHRVEHELSVIEGMEHTAVVRSLELPGATETLDTVTNFINRVSVLRPSAQSPHA